MARVLKHPHWYEQVLPSTLSETELEQKVLLYAPYVYSEYYVIPFKLTVDSPYGRVKPDLAFIAKDYRDWFVVEIEMGYHSLKEHIEPQVQRLVYANYNQGVVEYLCKKEPKLDFGEALYLIQSSPVRILLILNEPKPEWLRQLKNYDVIVAIFELFRSESYDEVYRIDGEYPTNSVASISDCFLHPFMPVLGIQDPDALTIKPGDRIRLRYNDCVTYWERNDDPGGAVWLIPTGRNPLDPNKKYRILQLRDSSLILTTQVVSLKGL